MMTTALRRLGYGCDFRGLDRVEPLEGAGWGPVLALASAAAFVPMALAESMTLDGSLHAEAIFWPCLYVMMIPATFRLVWPRVSRTERIWLLTVLGVGLYLMRVIASPTKFDGHDEHLHWSSAIDIIERHRLFTSNALLPVGPSYPALEIVTAAMVQLTGLGVLPCAFLFVGVLRLLCVWLVFLIFEKISNSSWVAALATVVYMANSNFYSFLSGFSYETIAVDFLFAGIFVAILVSRPSPGTRFEPWGLVLVNVAILFALAVAHHLTSWIGVLILGCVAVAALLRRDRGAAYSAAAFVVAAYLSIKFWKSVSGGVVDEYVGSILTISLNTFLDFLGGTGAGRMPFVSADGVQQPAFYRVVAILSVALISTGLVAGFFRTMALPGRPAARRPEGGWNAVLLGMRDNAWAIALTLSTFLFPLSIALRLTGGGWELGNRMSAFVFLGVGLVVAVGAATVWIGPEPSRVRGAFVGLCLVVLLTGGMISELPPDLLPGPYRAAADGSSIEPMGVATATWTREWLGEGRRFASDRVNRLLLATYGVQRIVTMEQDGEEPGVVVVDPVFSFYDRKIIQSTGAEFLLVDLRLQHVRPLYGHYFSAGEPEELHERPPLGVDLEKFDDLLQAGRIYDNGYEVIYDVGNFQEKQPLNRAPPVDGGMARIDRDSSGARTSKEHDKVGYDAATPGPPDSTESASPIEAQSMRVEQGAATESSLSGRAVVNEDEGVLRRVAK